MGDIINLRGRRKARAREEAAAKAAANRVRHGRTPGERRLAKAAEQRRARNLEGHRIESGEDS